MKARFDTTQESVTVRRIDGMDYIYICLNENIVKEIPEGQEEENQNLLSWQLSCILSESD